MHRYNFFQKIHWVKILLEINVGGLDIMATSEVATTV